MDSASLETHHLFLFPSQPNIHFLFIAISPFLNGLLGGLRGSDITHLSIDATCLCTHPTSDSTIDFNNPCLSGGSAGGLRGSDITHLSIDATCLFTHPTSDLTADFTNPCLIGRIGWWVTRQRYYALKY
jgi:hypothetical protein